MLSLRKVKAGTETGHGGALLIGLLAMTCSSCFLTQPGPPAQGCHCPQWAGPYHVNHQSRKCPTGQSAGATFSVELSCSQMTLLCKADIKTSQHGYPFQNGAVTWLLKLLVTRAKCFSSPPLLCHLPSWQQLLKWMSQENQVMYPISEVTRCCFCSLLLVLGSVLLIVGSNYREPWTDGVL